MPYAFFKITRAAPFFMAAGIALGASAALAQGAPDLGGFKHDSTQPIEISADSLEVRQQEQTAVFEGDVRANQGEVKMRANRIVVTYDQDAEGEGAAGAIQHVRAEGQVLITSRTETAQGDWADYNVSTGLIEMGGDVLLTQADNVISGSALNISLNTGQARIVGGAITGGGGGRVEAIFKPSQK